MDRIAILLGMFIGGIMGWAFCHVVPKVSIEVEAISAVIGATVGGAIGYLIAFVTITADREHATTRQSREFRPQIAGAACADCSERILLVSDGLACQQCGRVFCKNCLTEVPCPTCRAHPPVDSAQGSGDSAQ